MIRVAFHAINGVGLGHLVRTLAIANELPALVPGVQRLVVTNARDLSLLERAGIDYVQLPPRLAEPHADPQRVWQALPEPAEEAALSALFAAFAPDLVVFDTHAPMRVVQQLTAMGTRSVLVQRELRPEALRSFLANNAQLAFDKIVVPHDASEVDLAIYGENPAELVGPIVRKVDRVEPSATPLVVAMAGGGGQPVDARRYLRAVVDAHLLARARIPNLETILVTGPYAEAPANLEGYAGLTLIASTPDLPTLLSRASVVLSQAGYNAIAEIRSLEKPAILVPGYRKAEDQRERAMRLVRAGAALIAKPDARRLANAIEHVLLAPGACDAMAAGHRSFPLVANNRAAAATIISPVVLVPGAMGEIKLAALANDKPALATDIGEIKSTVVGGGHLANDVRGVVAGAVHAGDIAELEPVALATAEPAVASDVGEIKPAALATDIGEIEPTVASDVARTPTATAMHVRRVAIVAHDFAPKLGGMESVAKSLAEGLIERGVEARVYTTSQLGTTSYDYARALFLGLPRPLRIDLWNDLLATIEMAMRDRPDVIHLCNAGLGPWIPALRAALPCVVTANVHGNDLLAPWVNHGGMDDYRAAQVAGLSAADAVVCVSKFSREVAWQRGVREDVLRVVENGIDPQRFSPGPRDAALAQRFGIRDGDEVVLTVSRLAPRKGHRTMLHAIARIAAKRPRLKFVFTGAGEVMRRELMDLARELGIASRVIATGFVPDAELPALYRLANVFALLAESATEEDVEGFGVALLEAAATGIPTIATRSGGVPEAIADGVTGLLVAPGDAEATAAAIVRLLEGAADASAANASRDVATGTTTTTNGTTTTGMTTTGTTMNGATASGTTNGTTNGTTSGTTTDVATTNAANGTTDGTTTSEPTNAVAGDDATNDVPRTNTFGRAGRERVLARFSSARVTDQMLSLWNEVLARGPRVALRGPITNLPATLPATNGVELVRLAQQRAIAKRVERASRRETLRKVIARERVVRLRANGDGSRLLPDALADCVALGHAPRIEVKLRRFLERDFLEHALPHVEGIELVHGVPYAGAAEITAALRALPADKLARVRTLRLFLTPEAREQPRLASDAVPEAHALRAWFAARGTTVVPPPEIMRYLSASPAGGPETGMIEPTNLCNLGCPTCPTGTGKIKPLPAMTLGKFQSVLGQLRPKLRNLALWNYGEPLLNKELPGMIAHAKTAGVGVVKVSSNVHFLDGERGLSLLKSGLDVLILSVDGASQATYETFRKEGDFETVAKSVAWLCSEKKRLGLAKPRIELQFIVMRHNEHELPEMRRLAHEWGVDALRVKTVGADDDHTKQLVPASRLLSRYEADGATPNVRHPFCTMAWDHTVVNVDGSVTPCCYLRPDMGDAFVMGNVFEQPFTAIWRGEKYRAFRAQMLGDRGVMPVCNKCRGGTHDLIAAVEEVQP